MADQLISRIEELEKRVSALESEKHAKKKDKLEVKKAIAYQRYVKKIERQRRKDLLHNVDVQCCDTGPEKVKSYEEWRKDF